MKYPLCVKLGTVSPNSQADVYSYDSSEDCMVLDPLLSDHLAHFGLRIDQLKKTENSVLEMDIELNNNYEFNAMVEGTEALELFYGPGCVGMLNTGNSCYFNSVIQVLMSTTPFQERFLYDPDESIRREEIFANSPQEPQSDICTQFVKLAAILSNPLIEGIKHEEENGNTMKTLKPRMLRDALAAGNQEYLGNRQQDAVEYFQYVLDRVYRMDKNVNTSSNQYADPGKWFFFLMEEKLTCLQSKQVGVDIHDVSYYSLTRFFCNLRFTMATVYRIH